MLRTRWIAGSLEIMREYRHRGTLRSRTWEVRAVDTAALWHALTAFSG